MSFSRFCKQMALATSLYVAKVRSLVLPATTYQPWVISFSFGFGFSCSLLIRTLKYGVQKQPELRVQVLNSGLSSLHKGTVRDTHHLIFRDYLACLTFCWNTHACSSCAHLSEFSQTEHISVTGIQINIPQRLPCAAFQLPCSQG